MTAAQPYVAVSRRPLDLEDYISVARRHVGWIAGPTFAGLVVSVVVAFCLPNVYEAKAVMQITPSSISDTLVQSTVNQQLAERVQQMKTNIESRTSLNAIISDPRLNLYKEERNKEPMEDIEDEMRAAIQITTNPDSVTKKGASVFQISFQYKTKKGAQETVNTLITKFIDESSNSQRDQQNQIQDFFGEELTQAKANLEKQQELLTKFRTENDGRLPEQEATNLESLRSLQTQISAVNGDLGRLSSERIQLETHLATLENQLKLSASLAEEDASIPAPTSVAARQNDDLVAVNRTIDAQDLELQMLKQKYLPTTYEVKNAERNLAQLKKKRDQILSDQEKQQTDDSAKPKPSAPKRTNYKALEQQSLLDGEIAKYKALLHINDTDRDSRLKQLETFTKQSEDYRARLTATYSLQAPYQDLRRDYDSAAEKYEKYSKQKDITTQSAALIERRANEYLALLDAPVMPQKPISPKRGFIIGAGFGLSFMLGLALAGVQEARDASLKNLKDVRAYTNLPVLCSIPLLENTLLVKRKRRITALAWSAAVIVGLLAVGGALLYYSSVISIT